MSAIETISEQACFNGVQGVYSHASSSTGTTMQFSLFQPPQAKEKPVPVLWFLSGLTCTEENFTVKAGAQQYAANHGLMLVAPDTSPRDLDLPGEHDAYDFGSGAGFYVDATESPWSDHYNMYSYVTHELPDLIFGSFAGDKSRQGIFGHSMGGHGALVCALRNPDIYQSVSAFSPICAPTQCAWGTKALGGYLGADNNAAWRQYDACELINSGSKAKKILVDQGSTDPFLAEQLKPNLLAAACDSAGISLELRMQDGYDHSYFFIATFVGDHIDWHARALNG
jgi:S-formylglutathione hydrolase